MNANDMAVLPVVLVVIAVVAFGLLMLGIAVAAIIAVMVGRSSSK